MTGPEAILLSAGRAALDARGGGPWTLGRLTYTDAGRPQERLTARASRTGGAGVVVKVHADPARAEREADALSELSGLGAAVAAPLHLDRERGVLILPDLGPRTLQSALAGPRRRAALTEAGDWLAALARATIRRWEPFDASSDLERVARAVARSRPDIFERAAPMLDDLARRAAALGRTAQPIAMLHGDVKPANLVRTPQGYVAIDRADRMEGLPEFDAATLLRTVAIRAAHAARAGRDWPEGPRLRRKLLLAPLRAAGLVDLERLGYATRLESLRRWVQFERHEAESWRTGWLAARCERLFQDEGEGG